MGGILPNKISVIEDRAVYKQLLTEISEVGTHFIPIASDWPDNLWIVNDMYNSLFL